jgi:hypothetical protein
MPMLRVRHSHTLVVGGATLNHKRWILAADGTAMAQHFKTFLVMTLVISCVGCTMVTLRRETLSQVDSAVDLRFREIIENLALLADDPNALPFYASIYAGTSQITDTMSFGETTLWQRAKSLDGFGSQTANPQLQRQIGQNWTVDPMVDPERLEAMRYACWWVIFGPQSADQAGMSLLARPDQVPCAPGRHFGVLDDMTRLPQGWLQISSIQKPPHCAAYKAQHGKTWVWVLPEGVRGLADFSLVVQSISRVDINSTTLFNPIWAPATMGIDADADMGCNYTVSVTVAVDCNGKLAPSTPYYRWRLDSLGSDAAIRSQIIAAGATR